MRPSHHRCQQHLRMGRAPSSQSRGRPSVLVRLIDLVVLYACALPAHAATQHRERAVHISVDPHSHAQRMWLGACEGMWRFACAAWWGLAPADLCGS